MYEQASVISIQKDGKITVSCQTQSCANCKSSSFCGAKGKHFIAYNGTNTELSIGDNVELFLPPGKTVIAGFVALLLPVLLFPLGYYFPLLFTQQVHEGIQIIGGIGGIAIGFLISRIFSKTKAKEYTPEITRILYSEGINKE